MFSNYRVFPAIFSKIEDPKTKWTNETLLVNIKSYIKSKMCMKHNINYRVRIFTTGPKEINVTPFILERFLMNHAVWLAT